MPCFERLGHGEVAPDQAIQEATQAIAATGMLGWTMPLALGLWMNKRYDDALDALQRPGVESVCGHMAYFHILVGMVARQVNGNHQLACQAYERALQIEPNRHDTLYNLANLIKDDKPDEADKLYRRSLSINAESASTWHNFGVNLNSLNRYDEALNPLKSSLSLIPLIPRFGVT